MIFILDANLKISEFTIEKQWEILKNEIVYFKFNDNCYNYFNNNNLPATLQAYVIHFSQHLIQENKILKKRIQELTKLEKYKPFDSLEPKKRLKVTPEELDKIKELRKEGITISKIAKIYGVSEQTIYNYLKR